MIVHAGPQSVFRWRTLRHAALVVLALALAHEAIYWAEGQTELVPQDGAHAYWPLMLGLVAIAAVALAGWSAWRIGRSALSPASSPSGPSTFKGEWRSIIVRLLPAVTLTYLILENVEHLIAHGHLEGIDVFLMPGQLLSFPTLVAVVAIVAALGALVRWQEAVVARAARSRRATDKPSRPGATRLVWFHLAESARNARSLFFEDLGRAPPATSI